MIDKETRKKKIRSLLIHSQEELNKYGTLKDETLRAQAAEKIWMAFHKLLELTVGKTVQTGEIWKHVRTLDDAELSRIAGAAGALHNYHYTWEEYGPRMDHDFQYASRHIQQRLTEHHKEIEHQMKAGKGFKKFGQQEAVAYVQGF